MSIEKTPEEINFSPERPPGRTDRFWAMIAHFCILLPVVPCLLIYWVFEKRSRFIAFHASQALKPQFFMLALFIIPFIFFPNADGHNSGATLYATCVYPFAMVALFLGFIAGVEAARGKSYKYPLRSDKWV